MRRYFWEVQTLSLSAWYTFANNTTDTFVSDGRIWLDVSHLQIKVYPNHTHALRLLEPVREALLRMYLTISGSVSVAITLPCGTLLL